MIRQQKTKSGRLLEIDSFPVWNDGRRVSSRAPKAKPSTEEQKRYNKKQAEKKLIRLINANFDEDDIIMHPTYEPTNAPQDEKQARKDLTNYFRRLKTRRQKELAKVKEALKALPEIKILAEQREELLKQKKKLETPFKYIYVIECVTYKTGELKGCNNYHFHIIFTGGISRKELEAMWQNGIRTNADRFQPDKFGPEAIAKYMLKDPQGSKRYVCSRNLAKPKVTIQDNKITTRGLARIARERLDDTAYWERKYKGYRFVKCYARYNEYNGYWYMSVIMYKTDGHILVPRWEVKDWLDD